MRYCGPYLLAITTLLLLAHRCGAQVDSTLADSTRIPLSQLPPGQTGTHTDEEFVMSRSPTTAVLLSIVPGGGQIYNEQYWKVPLFAGAAGYFIYRVIHYHNLFSAKADEAERTGIGNPGYELLKRQRESYRDNRDLNAAYFLGIEILNMIDAYVGAHMFDFDVDDDVSSRIYLDPVNTGLGVSLRW